MSAFMQLPAWRGLMRCEAAFLGHCLEPARGAWVLLLEAEGIAMPVPHLDACIRLRALARERMTGAVVGRTDAWPLQARSIDLLLIRHALGERAQARMLLQEAARVLAPGGCLLIAGVHPCSLWHGWTRWQQRAAVSRYHVHAPWRLNSWLRDAGLQIEALHRYGGVLPGTAPACPGRGPLAACFLIQARKSRNDAVRSAPRLRRAAAAPMHASLPGGARRQTLRKES